jgi:hypothetical protein
VLLDNSQQASWRYGVSGIPMLFLVDRMGNVKFSQEGLNPALEGVLTAEIQMGTGTRNGR